jgi:hypothetical protein
VIRPLTTKAELVEALRLEVPIVITDVTRTKLHANPWSCGHVTLEAFHEKVVMHGGKNGGYFSVASFTEAQQRWPSVVTCE